MARQLGALLILLRERLGLTQKDLADKLCERSGQVTVTRHEVSRWEREERLPSDFWLGWLSKVLETPVTELEQARARSQGVDQMATSGDKPPGKVPGTKWRDYARSLRESSLALVTLKFEHRATSVQLSGTYEEPEQATAAIGMFRRMVTPGVSSRTAGQLDTTPTAGANGNSRRGSAVRTDETSGGSVGAGRRARAEAAPVRKVPASAAGATMPNPPAPSVRSAQVAPRPAEVAANPQTRTPARPGTASSGGTPARVPMGIRYTKGPGVASGNGAGRDGDER